jgi:hypothetical protein
MTRWQVSGIAREPTRPSGRDLLAMLDEIWTSFPTIPATPGTHVSAFAVTAPSLEIAVQMAAFRVFSEWRNKQLQAKRPTDAVTLLPEVTREKEPA